MEYTKPIFLRSSSFSGEVSNWQQFYEGVVISKITSSFYIDLFNDLRKTAKFTSVEKPKQNFTFCTQVVPFMYYSHLKIFA